MNVLFINPYEIGRQPFGLAEPAAWLAREGCSVTCCDLSIEKLDAQLLADADLVAIYLPMHTATRIAIEALPKIVRHNPDARLCVYGLYAPMNEGLFRSMGVEAVLGGEFEPGLLALVRDIKAGQSGVQTGKLVSLAKIEFLVPDRSGLPPLDRYARLILPDGREKTVGFAETTRGCKYLCRHCPVVPVYKGVFRVIPAEVVLDDIRNQIRQGAEHISFGDPDFFNGPGHALRIVRTLHEEFPHISYDATIKIEHIIRYPGEIRELKNTGCLLLTSAVESVDDVVLEYLDKGHTRADFIAAVKLLREAGIELSPTFVPFTPWTTLEGYLTLLRELVGQRLIDSLAPVQLSIRLLIPQGSYLLDLDSLSAHLEGFDPQSLGYVWRNPDPRVDRLQQDIQVWVNSAEQGGKTRVEIFRGIWEMTHRALGLPVPALSMAGRGVPVPRLSENWYCCAEPTNQQLISF